MVKPPMPYSGGKQSIAERIVDLFPAHDHYVEPFGGALSVLLAKRPSKIETVNDLNGDLMTFWRVLRDDPEGLERLCALTPHSRAEYLASRDLEALDDLERARRVWVQLTQGRGSRLGVKTGWRFVHGTNRMTLAKYLDGYLERIGPAARRLRNVTLECRDALDVIAAYERPGCLIYVDPPYLMETRHGDQYAHEFGGATEHERLLKVLSESPAAVVISGYDSDLYGDALAAWECHKFAATAMTGEPRTEVVWTNFPMPGALFGGVA
jgi:DNA adenine methylase